MTTKISKPTKLERATLDRANRIIHAENLYALRPDGSKERVVNAHLSEAGPVVTGLYTGTSYPLEGRTFENGYCSRISFGARDTITGAW